MATISTSSKMESSEQDDRSAKDGDCAASNSAETGNASEEGISIPLGGEGAAKPKTNSTPATTKKKGNCDDLSTDKSSKIDEPINQSSSWCERIETWTDENVSENLRFTIRVTLATSVASLFVLCQSPNPDEQALPSAFWVYVTAVVASWQTSPDLGSVIKKVWQRSVGTTFGGLIGLGLGAISLLIPLSPNPNNDDRMKWQAFYLGLAQLFMTFLIAYWSCRWGFRGHYSAILGTVTAGMALLAFYNSEPHEGWITGVFRITNILIGGIVGSVVSLVVFPVSTKRLIERKVKNLIQNTGTAAKCVLANTNRMGENQENDPIPTFQAMIVKGEEDLARDAYIQCIEELHKIKGLFPLLDYDPTFKRKPEKEKRKYIETWRIKLCRILRIHMNILWLDNIMRSKLIGDDELQSDLLMSIGEHIEELLDTSHPLDNRKAIETIMLDKDLPSIRSAISKAEQQRMKRPSSTIVDDPSVSTCDMISAMNRFCEKGSVEFVNLFVEKQTDTFYRMVEILILRIMRLNLLKEHTCCYVQ